MIFDIITIFPDFFTSILKHGALHRALDSGKVEVRIHDLRDFTDDPRRTVDDRPFGGGPGMVFKPEPIFRAVESIEQEAGGAAFPVILLSPQGRLLRQAVVEEMANLESPAGGGSLRYCSQETTNRFAAGAAARRSKRPGASGPTCLRIAP